MKRLIVTVAAAVIIAAVVIVVMPRKTVPIVSGESLLLTEPKFKTQVRTGGGLAGGPRSMSVADAGGGERTLDPGKISSYAIKDDMSPIEVLTPKEIILKVALWAAGAAGLILALFLALAFYVNRPKKVTPPDVTALVALRGLNADVQGGKAGANEFYSRLVPIVNAYFIARFSLERSEMTKTEILALLENIPEAGETVRETLARLLSAAESARYFDGSAVKDEMVRDIESVKEIIAATKAVVGHT